MSHPLLTALADIEPAGSEEAHASPAAPAAGFYSTLLTSTLLVAPSAAAAPDASGGQLQHQVPPPASLDASLPGRTDAGCDGGDATDDAAVAALAGMGFDTHGAGEAEPEEVEQESGRGGRKRRAPKHFGDDEDDGFAPRQRTLKPSTTTQPRFRYVPVAGTDAITAAAVVAAAMPPVVRRSDGSVPRYTGSRARFTPEAKAVLAKAVAENRGPKTGKKSGIRWTQIRHRALAGEYPELLPHLQTANSKCLEKHWYQFEGAGDLLNKNRVWR